jgi:uncharacterized protein YndB with AHSA1/START domain
MTASARAHATPKRTAQNAAKKDVQQLVIARIIDAPQEMVFQAWVDPEQVVEWYGPQGLSLSHVEMDVRPGGKWRKCMRSAEGKEYWRWGVYRQVIPPRRLSFTYYSDDIHASPDHEMLVTVSFEKLGTKTKLTLRQTALENEASRDSHKWGWTSTIERLAGLLEKK